MEFGPVADRIVDDLLGVDPELAGWVGDHAHDHRLPDASPTAVAAETAMLHAAAGSLAEVDAAKLDREDRVDHAILGNAVRARLSRLTELREHEWNPLAHNPGQLLYQLLARPFAPAAVRLEALAGRLDAIPDALATARATLHDMPRVHVETGIGQFEGVAALIRGEVPGLLAEAPELTATVEPRAQKAAAAVDEFVTWLRERTEQGRDSRLGRELWETKLAHTLDTELTAGDLLAKAWDNLDRVGAELREVAAAHLGAPATNDTVRAALDQLAEQRPDNATIVELARRTMTETTAFVAEHDLVSLVDDPLEILEMPEFARGVAVAYCDPPGPYETADVPTFYAISPTPRDWPTERVTSFYREYNNHMLRNLTVHEAMPGHYLQLAHARRFRGSSRARAACWSGSFVEGWAVYAEEVMARHGFGGLPVKLQQLKMQLRMTLNAILDQLVHCEGLGEDEAMRLMTERGFQEEGEAAGKWRRALLTSTQLSTYFVGYVEVAAVAARRPDGTAEKTWHDAMLAHGNPAPRHLATLLG